MQVPAEGLASARRGRAADLRVIFTGGFEDGALLIPPATKCQIYYHDVRTLGFTDSKFSTYT